MVGIKNSFSYLKLFKFETSRWGFVYNEIVVVFRPKSSIDLLSILVQNYSQNGISTARISARCEQISVHCSRPTVFCVDGNWRRNRTGCCGEKARFRLQAVRRCKQSCVVSDVHFHCSSSSCFLLVGFCGGLALRKWYGILQSQFSSPNKTVNTLKKVSGKLKHHAEWASPDIPLLVDQILFAPSFIAILVGSIGVLQGEKNIVKKLKREFPDILVANYKLWPAVQLLNFYFVPLNYQVVLVQIVAVAWNSYVSFKTNSYQLEAIDDHSVKQWYCDTLPFLN